MNFSRRGAIRLGCGCLLSSIVTTRVSAKRSRYFVGCWLTAAGYEKARGVNYTSSLGDYTSKLTETTGRPDIYRELRKAIAEVARFFEVNPSFGFYNPDRFDGEDEGDGTNAFASPRIMVPGTTGTIGFGMPKFRKELYGYDETGTTVMSIVAHEFAHNVQMVRGFQAELNEGVPLKREVNADFLPASISGGVSTLFGISILTS